MIKLNKFSENGGRNMKVKMNNKLENQGKDINKKKEYNKLVRDKIPQVCEKNNQIAITRVLNDEDYLTELNKKILEEVNEYIESGDIEELADLEEVLRAILDVKKCSYDEFEQIRNAKVAKRGAFKEKLFLESVEEQDDI